MLTGRCHCGAVRYEMPEEVLHHALCHCADCRRHAGAPMVAWAMVPAGELRVTGQPKVYRSSEHGRRHFCGACGTGLFHVNEAVLPGMVALVHKSGDGRGAAAVAVVHAMRCDTGMPSRAIRLSTEQPTLASVFWPGRVRARRRRPTIAL